MNEQKHLTDCKRCGSGSASDGLCSECNHEEAAAYANARMRQESVCSDESCDDFRDGWIAATKFQDGRITA